MEEQSGAFEYLESIGGLIGYFALNSPGDIDLLSWDAGRADTHATHCSSGCCASSRCTTESRMAPKPFAAASPVSGTWLAGSGTKPVQKMGLNIAVVE